MRGLAETDLETLQSKLADPNSEPDVFSSLWSNYQALPAPEVKPDDPLAMLILALSYDNYKGRQGIGKIEAGKMSQGQNLMLIKPDGAKTTAKAGSLQMYEGLKRIDVQEAQAGEHCGSGRVWRHPYRRHFNWPKQPGTAPSRGNWTGRRLRWHSGLILRRLAGREGKLVTSRNLRDRLIKELETNVALKVEGLEQGSDSFLVSGRGELHLAVLVETMRREGFEMQVSQPEVIYHEDNGQKSEPYESCGNRFACRAPRGNDRKSWASAAGLCNIWMPGTNNEMHAEYLIPTRGLIGLKNLLLTRTRGTIIMNNLFDSYRPVHEIDLRGNEHGSLNRFGIRCVQRLRPKQRAGARHSVHCPGSRCVWRHGGGQKNNLDSDFGNQHLQNQESFPICAVKARTRPLF